MADHTIAIGPNGTSDYRKLEVDEDGNLKTALTGSSETVATISGLSSGMAITSMTVTDVATKIPTTALTDRNTLSVRIWGPSTVYFGPSTVTASTGYPKREFEEIQMDIKETASVELYAICASGESCVIKVLELA